MTTDNAKTRSLARVLAAVLIAATVVGTATGAVRVWTVISDAQRPGPVLFEHGVSGVDFTHVPAGWTNEWCGECHKRDYAQWKGSRHNLSGSNENFEAQILDPKGGRKQWCMNCHVPINPGATVFSTREPEDLDQNYTEHPEWLMNGIDCLTCHVRDGQVLVTHASEEAATAHPIRIAPELGTAEFCGSCHQFDFHDREHPDQFHGPLQQASLEEFLEFRATGELETRCHDCHMPDGDHEMPGGYSLSLLQETFDLALSANWIDDGDAILIEMDLSIGHVGHRVPGGEHFFRFLSLQTVLEDEQGNAIGTGTSTIRPSDIEATLIDQLPHIKTFGHHPALSEFTGLSEEESGMPSPDTRLSPNDTWTARYVVSPDREQSGSTVRIRTELWYHVLDAWNAIKFKLSPDELRWTVLRREAVLTRPSAVD